MKKLFMICSVVLLGMSSATAQEEDKFMFNHLGVGLGVGTTGITIDASTYVTPYVGIRAGVNIFPNIKVNADLDIEFSNEDAQKFENLSGKQLPSSVEVQGKTSMTTGHLLFDLYPTKTSTFHFTVGAYFGGSEIIELYNKEDGALADIYDFNNRRGAFSDLPAATDNSQKIGLALGDYFLAPDQNGNVNASLEVSGFRPYVGIGFGRAVPKHRLGFQFDLGVQFWGSPKVYLDGENGKEQLTEESVDGDAGGAIKTLSKITVYPCLNFRLVGRIF